MAEEECDQIFVKTSKNNIFECDVCGQVFTRLLTLNEHKYIHTNSKPFKCSNCGKTFRQSSNYNKHQKLHENQTEMVGNKNVCKDCGRGFSCVQYLNSHSLSHNKTKSCLCEKCGNTFKHKCDLTRHLKIHENKRQYKCDVCHIGFNDSSALKRHSKKAHQKSAVTDSLTNSSEIGSKTGSNSNITDDNNNCKDIEINPSKKIDNDLNDINYLNSVIDYINVCRILPQPLPSHIFGKVIELQKEIGLHLEICINYSFDNYNTLMVGLQDLNAIVFEHLVIKNKMNKNLLK